MSVQKQGLEERWGTKNVFSCKFSKNCLEIENSRLFKAILVSSLMSYGEIMFFKRVNGKSQNK